MPINLGNKKIKLYKGNQKVKKVYLSNRLVYSAGNIVTYYVDSGVTYQEEVDEGESCLSPKTFTPSKSGWAFVGWRSDTTTNPDVYTSYVMGNNPVRLYAVFKQAVTVTYYNNSTTASSTSGYRYYNNGNTVNPSFALTQASSSGWTARGWSTSNSGNAGITYANGASFTRDSNVTLYGLYQQTITVTYYNNSTTASTTTGTRYWAPAGYINPSFTLTQSSRSGWTARGWSTGTAGNSAISYNSSVAFSRDSNVTLYGMYQQTITITYYNGSATAASTSGTRYYNSGKDVVTNPTFSLTPASLSGWTFRGWATSSGASATIAYSSISGTAFAASTTIYAAYYQTITLSYNGNGNTGGSTAAQTGTRYFNTGNYSNPSFTLAANGFSKTNYNFSKWALGSAGGTQYAAGASVTLSANTTMYAVWVSAGNPFYVVKNNQFVADDIYWVHGFVSGTNIDYIGMPSWNQVWGYPEDETERSSFVARSPSINTRYNSNLRITASCSSDWSDGYVKVNGQILIGSGTKIFDISELSSIQIEVGANAWPYGMPVVTFHEVYFY